MSSNSLKCVQFKKDLSSNIIDPHAPMPKICFSHDTRETLNAKYNNNHGYSRVALQLAIAPSSAGNYSLKADTCIYEKLPKS